jgi:hypothetical protein
MAETRTAMIDVAPELLTQATALFEAHGLEIIGSGEPLMPPDRDVVRVIVRGDMLPEECINSIRMVRPIFRQETKDGVRTTTIEEIKVLDVPREELSIHSSGPVSASSIAELRERSRASAKAVRPEPGGKWR